MRTLRHECLSACLVLSIPTAICLCFPYEALQFKGRAATSDLTASAAFVILSPEAEAAALIAAKTAWQSELSTDSRMRMGLPLGELAEDRDLHSLEVKTTPLEPEPNVPLSYRASAWAPSQKAAEAVRISPDAGASDKPAFPREELLRLN